MMERSSSSKLRLRQVLGSLRRGGAADVSPRAAAAGPGTEVRKLGVIMNGVTGRMGTNQHLLRSLVPMIREGGLLVRCDDGIFSITIQPPHSLTKMASSSPLHSPTLRVLPDPILVGRNAAKVSKVLHQQVVFSKSIISY